MSLTDAFQQDTLTRLAELNEEDFAAFGAAITLGYSPKTFYQAVQAYKNGQEVSLPKLSNQPGTLTVNAWSFVNDKKQYNGVYGLSVAEAADLKERLMSDQEKALKDIEAVVSARVRARGSNKGVVLSLAGMPGHGPSGATGNGRSVAAELKAEINSQGARYGQYKFVATATPYGGPLAFQVPLGMGLFAFFSNKEGAINVARITRVKGRDHDLVRGHVGFRSSPGADPVFGSSLPAKLTWDGKQGPEEPEKPGPVAKAATVATGSK